MRNKPAITDARAELDRRFAEASVKDRDLRKLRLEIDNTQIKINSIWEMAQLQVGEVRIREGVAKRELFSREKWLRAHIAHGLRDELGISVIPGYESPIDKLRALRRVRKKKERAQIKLKKQNATAPHQPEVGSSVCHPEGCPGL